MAENNAHCVASLKNACAHLGLGRLEEDVEGLRVFPTVDASLL